MIIDKFCVGCFHRKSLFGGFKTPESKYCVECEDDRKVAGIDDEFDYDDYDDDIDSMFR